MKRYAPVFIILLMLSCGIEDPVQENHFLNNADELDLDMVAGRNKPLPPIATGISCCDDKLTLAFTDSDNGDGTGYDIDGDDLYYFIYYSLTDPLEFGDEREYYDPLLYIGYITDIASVNIYIRGSGTVYIWFTAFDGWRESDHSDILSVEFPGPACE